jgi:hypothetical protein
LRTECSTRPTFVGSILYPIITERVFGFFEQRELNLPFGA